MSSSLELVLLRCLLGFLSAYHLVIGFASVLSLPATASITRRLYGIQLEPASQFGYAVKMLGLYALVFGGLLAIAAWQPHEHRVIVAAVILLQLMRAMARLSNSQMLTEAFHVSRSRNRANAALLMAEALALIFLTRTWWWRA